MKEERKLSLLKSFPPLTSELEAQLHGKGHDNFVIFLTTGNELFARCYHRYYDGRIIERQRYVFAKDGCVRYGFDEQSGWKVRKEFREPLFCSKSYGYTFDNSYKVLNWAAVKESCMKYSTAEEFTGTEVIEYLGLYCKHPNLEYLAKTGYLMSAIDEVQTGYWGGRISLKLNKNIDFKSNNLLKMLKLNRTEFATLKGSETLYNCYIYWRERLPKCKPTDLLNIARVFAFEYGTATRFVEQTGVRLPRLARYLSDNHVATYDYNDYLRQCRDLRYNLHDTAICMPHDFYAMHERLTNIIKYEHDKRTADAFKDNIDKRRALEFDYGDLIVRQPESIEDIVREGKILSHCVGGYAERHAHGKLHIMFLRKAAEPHTPFYTIEISTSGKIVQCRGYKNNVAKNGGQPKPQEIIDFEEAYQQYLYSVFADENKEKERRSA